MDLELLKQEVAKKKKARAEAIQMERLKKELFELDNPEIIAKQKAKEQKSANFRKGISSFFKSARKNIGQGAKNLNEMRSPKSTAKRMQMTQGSPFMFDMGPPSKSKNQQEYSLI